MFRRRMHIDTGFVAGLDVLRHQWEAFRAQDARILHWVVSGDERATVEAFLDVRRGAAGSFTRLTTPFRDPRRHGFELFVTLLRQPVSLDAGGTTQPWRAPRPAYDDDIDSFVRAATSFEAQATRPERSAIVLSPSSVVDPDAYARWLARLARVAAARPEPARFIVLDDRRAVAYSSMARAPKVWTTFAGLGCARTLAARAV